MGFSGFQFEKSGEGIRVNSKRHGAHGKVYLLEDEETAGV